MLVRGFVDYENGEGKVGRGIWEIPRVGWLLIGFLAVLESGGFSGSGESSNRGMESQINAFERYSGGCGNQLLGRGWR